MASSRKWPGWFLRAILLLLVGAYAAYCVASGRVLYAAISAASHGSRVPSRVGHEIVLAQYPYSPAAAISRLVLATTREAREKGPYSSLLPLRLPGFAAAVAANDPKLATPYRVDMFPWAAFTLVLWLSLVTAVCSPRQRKVATSSALISGVFIGIATGFVAVWTSSGLQERLFDFLPAARTVGDPWAVVEISAAVIWAVLDVLGLLLLSSAVCRIWRWAGELKVALPTRPWFASLRGGQRKTRAAGWIGAALVVGAVCVFVLGRSGEGFGIVNASLLNVRSGPGVQHAVVGTLAKGTRVQVLKEDRGWAMVHCKEGQPKGWVASKYLKKSEERWAPRER